MFYQIPGEQDNCMLLLRAAFASRFVAGPHMKTNYFARVSVFFLTGILITKHLAFIAYPSYYFM